MRLHGHQGLGHAAQAAQPVEPVVGRRIAVGPAGLAAEHAVELLLALAQAGGVATLEARHRQQQQRLVVELR